jgi:hypothetical protein
VEATSLLLLAHARLLACRPLHHIPNARVHLHTSLLLWLLLLLHMVLRLR